MGEKPKLWLYYLILAVIADQDYFRITRCKLSGVRKVIGPARINFESSRSGALPMLPIDFIPYRV